MNNLITDLERLVKLCEAEPKDELTGTVSMLIQQRMVIDDIQRALNKQTRKKKAIGRIINSLQQPR